jgi:HTTM domain
VNRSSPTVLGLAPTLPRPLSRWGWLTTPVPAERAAALRIAVAAVLLFDILVQYLPNLPAYYGPDGFGAPAVVDPLLAAPTWRWSVLRLFPPTWGSQLIAGVWAVAAFALLVGYRPRLAAAVCWVLAVSFVNGNVYLHNAGDRLKMFLLLMLVFLPSDGRWAIRLHPAARAATGPILIHPWPLRLMMLQLTLMYFLNGYYKALGPAWWDGTVMIDVANNPTWAHFSADYLPLPDAALKFSAWLTMGWELFFPLLVVMPLTRKATLWMGVFFHVATFVHLEVGLFALYALCFYAPLVPWEKWFRADGAAGNDGDGCTSPTPH